MVCHQICENPTHDQVPQLKCATSHICELRDNPVTEMNQKVDRFKLSEV